VYADDPSEVYPCRWAVVRWLDGVDASDARHHERWFGADLGHDLAAVVRHLRSLAIEDALPREPGECGGPLEALAGRVR